jgi:dienelactone hydrolase
MKPTPVTIPTGKANMQADLYSPAGTATAGLVVIAHGTDGFEDTANGPWKKMISGYGDELAKRGLFALIPQFFQRTKTTPGLPAADVIEAKQTEWESALLDAIAYGRALPRVDAARLGLLGFSLGGYLCLRIRAAAKPRALVEYFAPRFKGIGPAGQVPFALIHHGTKDTGPTAFPNAAAIKATLELEKAAVTLTPHEDATHGFSGKDKPNTDAAALSMTETLAFFTARL